MKTNASPLDRLLQAAAKVPNEAPPDMPFGFDTRVVALWRANDPFLGVTRLLRQVVFVAVTLIVLASAGAWRELNQAGPAGELIGDDYAFADSAISGAVGP